MRNWYILLVIVLGIALSIPINALASDVAVTINTYLNGAQAAVPYTITWADSNGTSGTISINSPTYTIYAANSTNFYMWVSSWASGYYPYNQINYTFTGITSSQTVSFYFTNVSTIKAPIIKLPICLNMVISYSSSGTQSNYPPIIINSTLIPIELMQWGPDNYTRVMINSTDYNYYTYPIVKPTVYALLEPMCTNVYLYNTYSGSMSFVGTYYGPSIPTIQLPNTQTITIMWEIGTPVGGISPPKTEPGQQIIFEAVLGASVSAQVNQDTYSSFPVMIYAYNNGSLITTDAPSSLYSFLEDSYLAMLGEATPLGNLYYVITAGLVKTTNSIPVLKSNLDMVLDNSQGYLLQSSPWDTYYTETSYEAQFPWINETPTFSDYISNALTMTGYFQPFGQIAVIPVNMTPIMIESNTLLMRQGAIIYTVQLPAPSFWYNDVVTGQKLWVYDMNYLSLAPSYDWLKSLIPGYIFVNVTVTPANTTSLVNPTFTILIGNYSRETVFANTYFSNGTYIGYNEYLNDTTVTVQLPGIPAGSNVTVNIYIYPFTTPYTTVTYTKVGNGSIGVIDLRSVGPELSAWSEHLFVTWLGGQAKLLDPMLPFSNKLPEGLPFIFLMNGSATLYVMNLYPLGFKVSTNGNYTITPVPIYDNGVTINGFAYVVTITKATWAAIYTTPTQSMARLHIWNPVHGKITKYIFLKCVNITLVPIPDDDDFNYFMNYTTFPTPINGTPIMFPMNFTGFNFTRYQTVFNYTINYTAPPWFKFVKYPMNTSETPMFWYNLTNEYWEEHEEEVRGYINISNPLQLITSVYSGVIANATVGNSGIIPVSTGFTVPSNVPEYMVIVNVTCPGFEVPVNGSVVNATDLSNFTIPVKVPVSIKASAKPVASGLLISGNVTDYFGSPAANVTVVITLTPKSAGTTSYMLASTTSTYTYTTTTNSNGEFNYLASVPPGSYTVTVTTLSNPAYTSNSTSTTASYTTTTTPSWLIYVLIIAAVVLIIMIAAIERRSQAKKLARSVGGGWI